MFGIVMEEEEPFHSSVERECDHIVHTGMTPANMLSVFLPVVLRIHDEEIRVFQKLNHFLVFAASERERSRRRSLRQWRMVQMRLARFEIREKSNRALRGKQTIANANAWMIGEEGFDTKGADGKIHFFELFNFEICRQLAQFYREKWALHLPGQNTFQALFRAFITQDAQMILGPVSGKEKGQSLDVVPMRMGQEQRQLERLLMELGLESAAQRAQARARIQNEDVPIGADLDTGGVAAVANRCRAGSGNGAAHTPEFQTRWRTFPGLGVEFLRRLGANSKLRQAGKQFLGLNRLGEIIIGSRLECREPITGIITARDDDNFGVAQPPILSQGAANGEPVAPRHKQVTKHCLRPVPLGQFNALVPVSRAQDFPTRSLQERAQEAAEIRIIIYD